MREEGGGQGRCEWVFFGGGGGLSLGGFGFLTGNLRLLLQQSSTSFAAARLGLHI